MAIFHQLLHRFRIAARCAGRDVWFADKRDESTIAARLPLRAARHKTGCRLSWEAPLSRALFSFPAIESLRFATLPKFATLFMRITVLVMSGSNQAPAAAPHSKLFIVARSRHIVPKERRIERLPSGYAVRESRNDSGGNYWFVVTALEVV